MARTDAPTPKQVAYLKDLRHKLGLPYEVSAATQYGASQLIAELEARLKK
jgi:hypothetical protein